MDGTMLDNMRFPHREAMRVLSTQHPEPTKPICEHGPTPLDLSQLRQIKILYNPTDEQLGKPPKYLSSQTKRLEDCKSHPGTFTLNLKIIYCRPTIRTCGSEASGLP